MQQQQIECANALYASLCGEYPNFIKEATQAMQSQSRDVWLQMKLDIGSGQNQTIEEFKRDFVEILLRFLLKSKECCTVSTISEFCHKCFVKLDDPRIQKNPQLLLIMVKINEKIKRYLQDRKDKMVGLFDSTSHIKSTSKQVQATTTVSTPTTIDLEECPPPQKHKEDFSKCPCASIKYLPTSTIPVKCTNCPLSFHQSCVKVSPQDQTCYICPYCTMHNIDLFSQVTKVLYEPTVFQFTASCPTVTLPFTTTLPPRGCQIQFRCLRFDDNHGLDDITWPDLGEIQINEQRVAEFRPLPCNSSLKKRRDDIFVLKEKINYQGQKNYVALKEFRPSKQEKDTYRVKNYQIYLIAIYIVELLTPEHLIKRIRNSTHLNLTDGKEYIRLQQKAMSGNVEGLRVDKLKISVACIFNMQRIQTPARGSICEHAQCFSLETFVNLAYSATHRKWRCPICKRKCIKITIDDYQQEIINQLNQKNIRENEITFLYDGTVDVNQAIDQPIESEEDTPPPQKPTHQKSANSNNQEVTPQKEIVIIDDEDIEDQPMKKVKTSAAVDFITID